VFTSVASLLRDPLTHFLLISAALLAIDGWRSPQDPADSEQIIVPDDIVESLSDSWQKRTGAPPTTAERQALVDTYVEEEVLYREGVRMGLDHGDLIVRRRLVQKMRFLLEDIAPPEAPSDDDLRAWLASHPDDFTFPARISLEHRYFSRDRHGDSTEAVALDALASLQRGEAVPGDPSMVAQSLTLRTQAQLARDLGSGFAAGAIALSGEGWAGPIASSYGLHLVRVHAREPARLAALDEVRPAVLRSHQDAAEREQSEALVRDLSARYTVAVNLR